MRRRAQFYFRLAALIAMFSSGAAQAEETISAGTSCETADTDCLRANFESYKSSTLDVVTKWASLEPQMKAALATQDQSGSLDVYRDATSLGLSGRYASLANAPDELIGAGVDANELYFVDTCRLAAAGVSRAAKSMATARWTDADRSVEEFVAAIADCEQQFKLTAPAGGFNRPPPNPVASAE